MPHFILPFLFVISLIACCIEIDMSVPGFPHMADDLGTSEGRIQLTVAYNFLGFFLSAFFYGPLSDCYGRRRLMIVGNGLLSLGALGCVYSPTIEWLLVARFIQGLGASASAVLVFAMIADMYRGEQAVRLIGLMNALLTILMALAPVIGSCINQIIGWRGNYGLVAIISCIAWILMVFLLPESKQESDEFRPKELIKSYAQLFSSGPFLAMSCVPSLLYASYLIFIASAPFLYMETFGLDWDIYALHQASVVGTFSITSILAEKITQNLGHVPSILLSIVLAALVAIGMVFTSLCFPNSPYLLTILMMQFSVGFALYYPLIFSASLELYPKIKGTASSAIMAMRALLCFSLVGISSLMFNGGSLRMSLFILLINLIGLSLSLLIIKYLR